MSPGRDNTSAILLEHHPNAEIARTEAIVEGNVDAPQDEIKTDSRADEGTGA
jgi:hypothetical protein